MKQQPSYALYILRRLSYRTGSIPCLLRDIPKIPLIFASASLPLLRAPLTMRGHTMGHHLYHPGGISCVLVKEGWCWWYRKYALRGYGAGRVGERRRERRRKACGLIRSPCRRGNGEPNVGMQQKEVLTPSMSILIPMPKHTNGLFILSPWCRYSDTVSKIRHVGLPPQGPRVHCAFPR